MKTPNFPQGRIDNIAASRLKTLRLILGISQEKMSKFVKLTVNQLKKYEDGLMPIAGSVLYTIAKILNVPMAYFIDMNEIGAPANDYSCYEQNDYCLMDHIVAEEKMEYLASMSQCELLSITEKEIASMIKIFSKIQNSQIRANIFELIKLIAESQNSKS